MVNFVRAIKQENSCDLFPIVLFYLHSVYAYTGIDVVRFVKFNSKTTRTTKAITKNHSIKTIVGVLITTISISITFILTFSKKRDIIIANEVNQNVY